MLISNGDRTQDQASIPMPHKQQQLCADNSSISGHSTQRPSGTSTSYHHLRAWLLGRVPSPTVRDLSLTASWRLPPPRGAVFRDPVVGLVSPLSRQRQEASSLSTTSAELCGHWVGALAAWQRGPRGDLSCVLAPVTLECLCFCLGGGGWGEVYLNSMAWGGRNSGSLGQGPRARQTDKAPEA